MGRIFTLNTVKKIARIMLYIVAFVAILVLVLRLSLMTKPVHRWLKKQIVSAANKQLGPELQIKELKGDLWKEAQLVDVRLGGADSLAQVDTLAVSYDLLSYFSPVFTIHSLHISGPFVKIRQTPQNEWNVEQWLKPAPADTASSAASFPIKISQLGIEGGKIDMVLASLNKDSALVISKLNLDSSLGIYENSVDFDLTGISFTLLSNSLNDSVSVNAKAKAAGTQLSLQQLVLATGNSVIRSSGHVDMADSAVSFNMKADPLFWKDIVAYAGQSPVKQNVYTTLHLSGNVRQMHLGLDVQMDGLQAFTIGSDFSYDSTLVIKGVQMSADLVDGPKVMHEAGLPVIHKLNMQAEGRIPVNRYRRGLMQARLSAEVLEQGAYRLDNVQAEASLKNDRIELTAKAHQGGQLAEINGHLANVWSSKPHINITAKGRQIDPSYWAQDKQYKGSLDVKAVLKGRGWYPAESEPWSYDVRVDNSRLFSQPISELTLQGKIGPDLLTNESMLRFKKKKIWFKARATGLQSKPVFNYSMHTNSFDLAALNGLDSLKSAISARIEGKGSGNSLADLRLLSKVRIDSSVINGERIKQFSADVSIRDTLVILQNVSLNSSIAKGTFDGRFKLLNFFDPSNELNLELQIEDPDALAFLAGTNDLQGQGTIKGRMFPQQDKTLKFNGDLKFTNILYGDTFKAREADGHVEALLVKNPSYSVDIHIESPSYESVQLRSFQLQSNGKYTSPAVEGSFSLYGQGADKSEIHHTGSYRISPDSVQLITKRLDFKTAARTLSLQHPFTALLVNNIIRTDTLRLSSEDGALLEVAVPYADSLRQKVHFKGQKLDLRMLQQSLVDEAYFGGNFSGQLDIDHSDSALTASARLMLSEVAYKKAGLDTVTLNGTVKKGELEGTLDIRNKGQKILEGRAKLPFTMKEPPALGEAFFKQPIQGYLKILPISLKQFRDLLPEGRFEQDKGTVAFTGKLDGTVEEPRFKGNFKISDPVLSGVKMDSIALNVAYKHEQSRLAVDASFNKTKQKIASLNASIPFSLDMKTLAVSLPGAQDSVTVDVKAANFNLAMFNDFFSRDELRGIEGRLSGSAHIEGPAENLVADGTFNLKEGAVRIERAGIRIDHITSRVELEGQTVKLADFSAKSGKGSLSAQGTMALKQLIPGAVDIELKADNFKAANTSEYNAVIDMDAAMKGTFTKPEISGKVSFISGFIELRNFGEKSVEDVTLDSLSKEDYDFSVYDSLALNMDVSFNRRFSVRNERNLELQIALDGQVDLLKKAGEEIQIFGNLSSAQGYVRPLGKKFDLEEGGVTFTGDPTNPTLNIRTLYEPPQPEEPIKIWYVIEGTVEDPKFKYESQPPMELQNILSYTLFGQPFYALSSWKQLVASSGSNTSATDVALDVLMDRIESLATRRLGIDVVRIDNTRIGGETGTSITTGWYISPRTFFAMQNVITGSTPDRGFLLEYMLKKNLKLIITQGINDRDGIGLKWNYDY